ncbi:hypothetical protein FRC01_002915 [Tulasnella sp. 417]|nr:hypothetical protein FRC01_002915 [Tulasnella sp. 417]
MESTILGKLANTEQSLLVTSLLATAYDANQSVPQLGASSTAKEWTKQARQYFSKSLYGEAAFCFTKAGMNWWASVALVYADRQVATRLPEKHPRRLAAFAEVAQNFDRLAQVSGRSEDPKNALLLFTNAGECFAIIPNHLSAAGAFFRGQKFTEAAYHYRMQGMFDEALDVIKTHPVDPEVARSIEYAAKLVFSRKRDVQSLHKAREICESKDEFLEFLHDHGFEEQRIQFLESITEHEEAAAVFWRAKDHVEAISRFLISTKPSSSAKAAECLLDGLRFNITLGFKRENALPVVSKLLSMVQQLPLDQNQRLEVSLFQAIENCRVDELLTLGRYYINHEQPHSAFLALDSWLRSGALKGLEVEALDQVATILLVCQQYCGLVQTVLQRPDLLDKAEMQQILGISWSSNFNADDQDMKPYRQVHPQSFIYAQAYDKQPQTDEPATAPTLSRDVVDDLIRNTLLNNLLRTPMLATTIDYMDTRRYLLNGKWFMDKQLAFQEGFLQEDGRPIAGAALTWFNRRTGARHNLGVYTIRHILHRGLPVDVDVLSSYVEEVCGQLILNHFKHYMSSGYEGMTMPRSWIIRALMRGSSELSNGRVPYTLIPWLRFFLDILVGRLNPGRLRYRGTPLQQSPLPILIVVRVCRCMVILGINNRNAREQVFRALEPLKHLISAPDPGLNRLITAQGWRDVEDAAYLLVAGSTMDGLVTVTHTTLPSPIPRIPGSQLVFCTSDSELLRGLLLDSHVPLAAPFLHFVQSDYRGQTAPPEVSFSMAASATVDQSEPPQGSADNPAENPAQLEGIEYTQQHMKSARVVQSLFRRHRRRAGGPIVAAFEELARRGLELQEPYRPGRFLLLCLRGPLPHVLQYLQKLKDSCQETISSLNKRVELSNHEEIDALYVKGAEARRIRDETNKLYKELQPSSELYFKGPETAPPSVAEIVEKVNRVSDLANCLRRLTESPDDLDYDLGVEPLLSHRVPWRLNKPDPNDPGQPSPNNEEA